MTRKHNRPLPRRHSIRLKNYDYSQSGLYYITICTQGRIELFGKIVENKIILNDAGKMIEKIWLKIPKIFPNARLHEYIIMPNHFHAIVEIIELSVGAESISARNINIKTKRLDMESIPPKGKIIEKVSLPKIVQTFKRYTTVEYIKMVKQNLLPPFKKRIWQRNYYEHIIRDEKDYLKIAEYIISNPLKWEEDKYYVKNN